MTNRGGRALDSMNAPQELRWVNQLRDLRVSIPADPKTMAKLMIEYGATLSHANMWETGFDGDCLFKIDRKKKFVCQLDEVHKDNMGNLHHDSEPAVVSGEDKFYFLHGMYLDNSLKHWLIRTAEELDAQEVLAIPNVDLRREMIRKKGIEQLLDSLFSRTLDTQGDYSLHAVMLGRDINSACNFLKMLNPSIGVWHMEGVPNNIRTVREALLWRNNGWFEHAEKIT